MATSCELSCDGDYDEISNTSNEENKNEEESESDCYGNNTDTNNEIDSEERNPDPSDQNNDNEEEHDMFSWTTNLNNFTPKEKLPSVVDSIILADVGRSSSELDIFF